MNIQENYYDILGIDRKSNEKEIKTAYRKLAIKYHPDKNNGDEERFKKIAEAYNTLSDKSKRAQYDICGFSEINLGDPMDIFNEIFNDFKPDAFSNLSDNIMNSFSGKASINIQTNSNLFNDSFNDKLNEAIPDMLNTFKNVISEKEDNSMKSVFMKTFINGVSSSFSNDNSIIKEDLIKENKKKMNTNKNNKTIDVKENDFNETIENNKDMSPGDIVIKKKYPLKDFYLNKNKRLKYTHFDIVDGVEKKVSNIINVPLYYKKEIRFENLGHKKKNFKKRGDITFIFDCLESDFKIHDYHLIYNKNINVSNLYDSFNFSLILPDDTELLIDSNDLYKTDLIIEKKNLGLPIPNDISRSNLYIKFNIIYPELSEDKIKQLKDIFKE